MTTIVGDWGNKVLVADSQFTDTVSGIKYFEDKVFPVEGGWLGVAGNYCDAEKVVDYVNKKTKVKPKLKTDSSFLKLTKDGLVLLRGRPRVGTGANLYGYWLWVYGSGSLYAYGSYSRRSGKVGV
jgi:hypothetical protein